jgi:exodeoxyribonuclease VII large subunit
MGTNFFDFKEQVSSRKPKAATPAAGGEQPLTVTQLTAKIDQVLRSGIPGEVLVKGEVSNFRPNPSSGHVYFTMKDAGACVYCVMWKSDATKVPFKPTDGMELLARGTIGVYREHGKYQLYVKTLQPLGKGALELAFQQMKAKLEAEGLFARERKRPLPRYPQRIVLVTSSSAAALQDMLKVLRRYPWVKLFVYHVPVQGEGCGQHIAGGLAHLNRTLDTLGGADVIILSRGGGSLEDLWGFNEEAVARAVAASRIPVVTGIGHEVDVSIADLVADYHAHTPTEAAQVVTANWRSARESVATAGTRLSRAVRLAVQHARQRLTACERHEVFRRPLGRILTLRQLVDDRQRSLTAAAVARVGRLRRRIDALGARLAVHHPRNVLALATQRVDGLARHLASVSPGQVLKRGYSITTRKRDGAIVRDANVLKAGERVVTKVAEGSFESVVDDGKQPRLFE